MLHSTVEVVTQVTINSHFIFCFCNIIIVLLLIDRARSNSYPRATTIDPHPLMFNGNSNPGRNDHENNAKALASDPIEINAIDPHPILFNGNPNADDQENYAIALESDAVEFEGYFPEEEEDDEEDDGEDNDELRTRIEEFINKVNREWRLEKQRASCEVD